MRQVAQRIRDLKEHGHDCVFELGRYYPQRMPTDAQINPKQAQSEVLGLGDVPLDLAQLDRLRVHWQRNRSNIGLHHDQLQRSDVEHELRELQAGRPAHRQQTQQSRRHPEL